jgi:tRNA(Ile)-lysidine synthase
LVRAGDRMAAAVSGGADSVALLFLLLELRDELGIVLSVAHVNHRLRGEESDGDEQFVSGLARQHGLEIHVLQVPIEPSSGISSGDSSTSEAVARELRYGFFRQLAREGRVGKIATAHTLDDQAETVLLRIFRGTGIRGLAGIHPRIVLEEQGRTLGEVVRPLLDIRRSALLEFLRDRGLSWREDSSNRSLAFLRNRVRHRLLPVISEEFGEPAIEHMSELAEIARAEEEHLELDYLEVVPASGDGEGKTRQDASLRLDRLSNLPLAARRRLVRSWLEAHAADSAVSFRLIDDVLELAGGPAGRKLELTHRLSLRRGRRELLFEFHPFPGVRDYEYALAVPGTVKVPELGCSIEARLTDLNSMSETDRCRVLDLAQLPKEIVIRNWRAGDRYWPARTSAAKKVKELLSDRHSTGAEKRLWPVADAPGLGLVWMRGFAVPAALRAPEGADKAIWIREITGLM